MAKPRLAAPVKGSSALLVSAHAPRMPLVLLVRPAAAAVKNGLAPTEPVPAMKVRVELAVRVKVPPRLTVA